MRSHVWNDMVFVNISEVTPAFELYAAELMAWWREFDQTLYHGGANTSLFLRLEFNWKLVVKKCLRGLSYALHASIA